MSIRFPIPCVLVALLALQACSPADNPGVQDEVAQTRAAAQQMIAQARDRYEKVAAEAQSNLAEAKAQARAQLNPQMQPAAPEPGAAEKKRSKAKHDEAAAAAAEAEAANEEAARNAAVQQAVAQDAEVIAARRQAVSRQLAARYKFETTQVEADYKLAIAECGKQASLQRNWCEDTAKRVRNSLLATLKQHHGRVIRAGTPENG